ncbi:NAD-aldehyde dehydrogenase [Artomyces pyxidatus]|uniref:NAD-aldehyde dehydrogenase n=1 Tax=Artomyces pyxidatus TaxID=48021 RepID=A0ACB8T6C0_9AGAM|nr:NAD-aldehyde dehydrogenase [Artomyces pyxidatus]
MTIPVYTMTAVDEIPVIRERLRRAFRTGKAKPIEYRKQQLLALAYMLQDNDTRFKEAMMADLHRPATEADFLEIKPTITEAKFAYDNVSKWATPESPALSFNWFAMKPTIRKEAKGIVLIISPFNYPVTLLLGPLAGAIAAGNACVMKPSELTPAFSALLAELVPKYLDPEMYVVVNGAVPETTKLLELQWDHILYTGGARVARIVLTAAAQTLSPVTTELGGKSPAFIDPKCDLKVTAKRLMWGKITNAGQTCVAPDYVLVPKDFVDKFVEACIKTLNEFYPQGAEKSGSFARIISPAHFARIKAQLDATKGKIVYGGSTNAEKKFIEPTLVVNVRDDDSLMKEEIFGPVLPIVAVESLDEALEIVNSRDHPLALYAFSKDAAYKAKVFNNTHSGACIANETLIHVGAEGLPFGGIGPSGAGAHTGKYSFDTFTHLRSTLDNPGWLELILGGRYPPYTDKKLASLALLFPALPPRGGSRKWGPWLLAAAAAAAGTGMLLSRRPRFLGA